MQGVKGQGEGQAQTLLVVKIVEFQNQTETIPKK